MKVSIIVSVYNRAKYFRRSLETWIKQTVDFPYDIIIVDDKSDDNLKQIIEGFKDQIPIQYLRLEDKKKYRGHTVGYNRGLALSDAEICIFTHPEIMFPNDLLFKVVNRFDEIRLIRKAKHTPKQIDYMTMKPFWLPDIDIDNVNWRENIYTLLSFLDFNEDIKGKPIDYRSQTQMLRNDWGSTTTFAMRRKDLKQIRGFKEFDMWGPDDIHMARRRKFYKMKDHVLQGAFVFHQNHDKDSTNQREDMYKVFKATPLITREQEAVGDLPKEKFKLFKNELDDKI